ncbi:protein kinase [Sorangium sp. So ce295]|uniref:protein kinase domain-containing protein n=1 Tax=Sorangium sp. So ce295 TaxID=3133295 RepID=UPI003F600726
MATHIFISYAPEDQLHLKQLETHIAVLKQQQLLSAWHRGCVDLDELPQEAIAAQLEAAEVILLLVSADFVHSDVCRQEWERAMERSEAGSARVVPILVRPCDLQGHPIAGLKALPEGGTEVARWSDKDEAWKNVAEGIRAAVEQRGAGDVKPARVAAKTSGARTASPCYADRATRAMSEQLAAARVRLTRLAEAGESTLGVKEEILELKRKLREGGQLRPGDDLGDGRYLLLEAIGRGGFATVWRARDQERGDLVAIKVLRSDIAGDESRRDRFFRGARAMAKLEHPGVVRILDTGGVDGGWYYFVMELVAGQDLNRAVLGKRLPAERLIPVLLGAGGALAHAHGRGLVHRDVKPANILLDTEWMPRLTDFDLVRARDTTGGTRTGALGSFLYGAPELIDQPQVADARADVYGLGMTAIFCIHGAELPAISGRDPEQVLKKLPCSEAVRSVLRRATQFNASERFLGVGAFCEALRHAAAPKRGAGEVAQDPSRADVGGTESAIEILITARQQAERVQSRPSAKGTGTALKTTALSASRPQPGDTAKGAAPVLTDAGHSSHAARDVANPKLPFRLKRMQFDYGTATINQANGENELLDEIASFLRAHPEIVELEVQGHTDDIGGQVLNGPLSTRRANVVRAALMARGISGDRLTARGCGSDMPLGDNETEEGRRMNRRVEFKIVKKAPR